MRKRFTIADQRRRTLLPAIPGLKYRMVDAKAIAIGGAVTRSPRSTSTPRKPRQPKLVAFAQASLTQSTVLTSGGAGAAGPRGRRVVHANDVGTRSRSARPARTITVATNIDVEFTYSLE
jgi:hypothetical protein